MKTFDVTVACTLSAYGTHTIEAETREQALAILKKRIDKDTVWDVLEADWGSADDHKILLMVDNESLEEIITEVLFDSEEWGEVFSA